MSPSTHAPPPMPDAKTAWLMAEESTALRPVRSTTLGALAATAALRPILLCQSEDPYKTLGVKKDASHEEIRRAYKIKAAKAHCAYVVLKTFKEAVAEVTEEAVVAVATEAAVVAAMVAVDQEVTEVARADMVGAVVPPAEAMVVVVEADMEMAVAAAVVPTALVAATGRTVISPTDLIIHRFTFKSQNANPTASYRKLPRTYDVAFCLPC